MKKVFFIFIFIIIYAFAANDQLLVVPQGWPQPVYNFSKNLLTENKVLLGKTLFYEPMLSANNTISCESCHSPFSSFTHIDHSLSHGIHDSIGSRNSPALINLAWKKSFMWDGAINNLDMQALAPISHPAEMGSDIKKVVNKLNASKLYRELFFNAYGDSVITGEKTLKAISSFLITLVSANSKYDRVIAGLDSFTEQELAGYSLFKKNCSSCHTEPLFSNEDFANNGLSVDSVLHDTGKMKLSQNAVDSLKFKIPTLRNIEYTFPYMHDGRFKTLRAVLNHYTDGIVQSETLAPELKGTIVLNSNDKTDLISFLMTLSDKEFVFNTKHQYPKEIFITSAKDSN